MRENPSLSVNRAAGAWDLFRGLCHLGAIVVCYMELLVDASWVDLLRMEACVFHLAVDKLMHVAWVAMQTGTFVGKASIVVVVHEVQAEVREDDLAVGDASDFVRDHLQNPYSS